VLLYNHVPYLLPLLALLVGESYVASFVRWALLLLTLYLGAALVLAGLLRGNGWGRHEIRLAAAGMLTFFPLFVSLMNGQDTAFAVMGLALWCGGLLGGRDWLAGLGLALTTVRPHLALFLAVPFLFRRQKVFGWFCAGAAGLALMSLLVVGPEGVRAFLELMQVSAAGEWYGLKQPEMLNLVGLLWRAAPGLGGPIVRWIGWAAFAVGLAGCCILWARTREIGARHLCRAVTVAVFLSPHLHYHDLTWLLPVLVLAMMGLKGDGRIGERGAAILPLAASWALILSGSWDPLHHALPYLLMLGLILVTWSPRAEFQGWRTSGGSSS
jgi:hypothetical protein